MKSNLLLCNRNTSLAAQGALDHRLQHIPRPIHNNAKSGAHPGSPPLGFNVTGGVKNKKFHTKFLKCPRTDFVEIFEIYKCV